MSNKNQQSLRLLRRARQDDQDASQELVMRFREPLLGRIRLMMGEKVRRIADSQDFLQQVMLDFLEASKPYEIESEKELFRWLTAVARNNIRDAGRRRRIRAFDSLSESFSVSDVQVRSPSPPSEVALQEDALRMVEVLERLKPDYRVVIELHDLEGLNLKEAAERMGRSHEAAKKLHARAMVQLGVLLSPSES